ncbi:MAG: DUF302 domain-containing protein [Anaerolineae bacterium]|nr:DUF302 domain-containing protein [Anaerolineae bacterium]
MSQDYGLRTTLDVPYETAIEQVTAALKTEGFGVLTEIDVKATLKKKLDVDFRRYIILGACNPNMAHQALQVELELGLLLPCNVIVYENDAQQSVVSVVDPVMMMSVVDNDALTTVAHDVKARLQRVVAALNN